jgi:hypothetical protein
VTVSSVWPDRSHSRAAGISARAASSPPQPVGHPRVYGEEHPRQGRAQNGGQAHRRLVEAQDAAARLIFDRPGGQRLQGGHHHPNPTGKEEPRDPGQPGRAQQGIGERTEHPGSVAQDDQTILAQAFQERPEQESLGDELAQADDGQEQTYTQVRRLRAAAVEEHCLTEEGEGALQEAKPELAHEGRDQDQQKD